MSSESTFVLEKEVPILGVCVGMQIMAEASEEGTERGLSWIKGSVKKIDTTTEITAAVVLLPVASTGCRHSYHGTVPHF